MESKCNFDGVCVGDYVAYSASYWYGNGMHVAVVTKVGRSMFYIDGDAIKFRKTDGKMIGGRCYARYATDTDIKAYKEYCQTEQLRSELRFYMKTNIETMALSMLVALRDFINDYKNGTTDK